MSLLYEKSIIIKEYSFSNLNSLLFFILSLKYTNKYNFDFKNILKF